MRYLLCFSLFMFIISCGNPQQVKTPATSSDDISNQENLSYTGILKIYRASSGCMGSGGSHIGYQQVTYQVGSQSSSAFNQLIDNLFNNNELHNSFAQDGCFNFYNLSFSGDLTQELVWTNGSEIMRKVIQVKTFEIK